MRNQTFFVQRQHLILHIFTYREARQAVTELNDTSLLTMSISSSMSRCSHSAALTAAPLLSSEEQDYDCSPAHYTLETQIIS